MRNVPAWLLSLVLHACILVGIGTFWVARPKGTGGERERPIGVAVVYEADGGEEYLLQDGGGSNATGGEANSAAGEALPSNSQFAPDNLLDDLLPGASGPSGDLSQAAGGLGLGEGGAELGGSRAIPKVKTTVFGIEGEGTRFLYVFDRSDSMNGYNRRPLQAAKSELLESLQSLGPAHQFQVIFYNDTPLPYGGLSARGPQLLHGDEPSKNAAQRFVRDVVAIGGTRHVDALRMAIAMGPDVIFFLTDADHPPLPVREIDDLHTRASRIGATIHAIQFGAGSNQTGGGWIQQLAAGTAGQYRYVDVTRLGEG